MSIFVTGGAGYIGSHVCKKLKEEGFSPITFDNLSTGHKEMVKWGPLFVGDLINILDIEKAFSLYRVQAVIHFAALALVQESMVHPELYYQNNVVGSLNLLQVCQKFGVKSIVFSSTCATFGIPKKLPITEKTLQHPINPYGESKLMVEKMLMSMEKAYGIRYAILRYFNAAGADFSGEIGENHEPETHLIPLILSAALKKTPNISVYGTDFPTKDGTAVRDYIHVIDLANAHILALKYLMEKRKSLALNLGSGVGRSVSEVITAVEQFTRQKIEKVLQKRREGDPPILIAANGQAKKLLGWQPKYSDLSTLIESAYNYYETHSFVGR